MQRRLRLLLFVLGSVCAWVAPAHAQQPVYIIDPTTGTAAVFRSGSSTPATPAGVGVAFDNAGTVAFVSDTARFPVELGGAVDTELPAAIDLTMDLPLAYPTSIPPVLAVLGCDTGTAIDLCGPTSWLSKNATAADGATACTNSAQALKGTAGLFGGYIVNNPNTSDSWLHIYNVASGSVTVGTTNPQLTIRIPGISSNSVAGNLEIGNGVTFDTAMSFACTSTAGGAGAPSTAVEVDLLYR